MDGKQRLDKWLWFARFFKTRSLAAAQVQSGAVRVNGTRVEKRATTVAPGDVLTLKIGDQVRLIRIEAPGVRRGPAPEAQTLYTDLSPDRPDLRNEMAQNPGFEGKGRPTKRDRRALDLSRTRHLE